MHTRLGPLRSPCVVSLSCVVLYSLLVREHLIGIPLFTVYISFLFRLAYIFVCHCLATTLL